jgi:hypothetical protein
MTDAGTETVAGPPGEDDSMGNLPFAINHINAPDSMVFSADLNNIESAIVANIGDLITALGGADPDTLVETVGARLLALATQMANNSHGEIEIPLDLGTRLVIAGTWTVESNGLLTESGNVSSCRIPVSVPIGSVISGIRVRGKQTGATDQFTVELQGASGVGAGAPAIGDLETSDGTTIEQDVPVVESETVDANTRYFIRIGTTGGGSGDREISQATVTYRRDL